MNIVATVVLLLVVAVIGAVGLSFAMTFGLAFVAIAAAVLWMSFVYLAITRLDGRRLPARQAVTTRTRQAR